MKVFEPITIRGMTLKNRIVMPPMQVNVGFRSRRAQAYYSERARGGAGAIIVAATSIDQFLLDEAWGKAGGSANFVAGAAILANAVHEAGAKVGIQIWHGNRYPSGIGMTDNRGEAVAPSPREDMRELTVEEIRAIVYKFALAAVGAKMAGYDFVEFHGSHGYMPCQFFSPAFNKRGDEYGGSLEGRMRFGLECVREMRSAVGDNYPIFYRLGAWEDRPDGIKLEDGIEFAVTLEKAGVDVLDISAGSLVEPGFTITPGPDRTSGTYVHLAAAVKERVGIPVIAVGRINSLELAESIVAAGKADIIAVGRQLIADPLWTEKVASKRDEDIVPCLSCNICLDTAYAMGDTLCAVNPSFGKESEHILNPAEVKQKVLVVGGGPAGMEAARMLANRGHEVTLWDKEEELGGQLILAGIPPYKDELVQLNKYLIGQLKNLKVNIRLGIEATIESIEEFKPDAVVLATGARPRLPEIPGMEKANVVLSLDVLAGKVETGERVVVIGGELVGCEVADYLTEMGKKVTVMRRGGEMAKGINPLSRDNLLARLARKGVTMLPGVKYEAITEEGVVITKEGKKQTIMANTVVIATGAVAETSLLEALQSKGFKVYPIGDCVQPRRILDAIHEGARVGREL